MHFVYLAFFDWCTNFLQFYLLSLRFSLVSLVFSFWEGDAYNCNFSYILYVFSFPRFLQFAFFASISIFSCWTVLLISYSIWLYFPVGFKASILFIILDLRSPFCASAVLSHPKLDVQVFVDCVFMLCWLSKDTSKTPQGGRPILKIDWGNRMLSTSVDCAPERVCRGKLESSPRWVFLGFLKALPDNWVNDVTEDGSLGTLHSSSMLTGLPVNLTAKGLVDNGSKLNIPEGNCKSPWKSTIFLEFIKHLRMARQAVGQTMEVRELCTIFSNRVCSLIKALVLNKGKEQQNKALALCA